MKRHHSHLSWLLILPILLFAAPGCSDKEPSPERKAELEFRRQIIGKAIDIGDTNFIGFGGITVQNNTAMDWYGVELILNPPVNLQRTGNTMEDITNLSKALLMLTTKNVGGFRAPPDISKIYGPVNRGAKLQVSWGDFVHKDTRERFSTNRYEPSLVLLVVEAHYEGRLRKTDYIAFLKITGGKWTAYDGRNQ